MESRIKCPNCGQEYDIDDSFLGQTVKCESCGTLFAVAKDERFKKTSSPSSKKKTFIFLSIVAVVFVAIILGIILFPGMNANIAYKKGMEAQREHRYDAAFEYFKKAAEKGHPEAQYELGCCYSKPEGTALDNSEAIKWLRKAAEQGHMDAQYGLGRLYQAGVGVRKSTDEAIFCFEKAAEQGHKDAPYQCGICYFDPTDCSFGMLKDPSFRELIKDSAKKALPWYKKAADMESKQACYNIGLLYEYGLGVDKDCREAIKWFQKTDYKGKDELKICELLLEMEKRDIGSNPEKQYELAELYRHSFGHDEEAIDWYVKAAEQGYVEAMEELAFIYTAGLCGVRKSKYEAEKWEQMIRDAKKEQNRQEQEQRRLEEERLQKKQQEKEREEAKRRQEEEERLSIEMEKERKEKENRQKAEAEQQALEQEKKKQKENSDEDSDGFTYAQETEAGTNPRDSRSHPKYITQVYISSVSQQSFSGLELVSIENRGGKGTWEASFNVIRNNRKRSEVVRINDTFYHNNTSFSVVDIEDTNTGHIYDGRFRTTYIVYIKRVGRQERIPCRIKEPVYDPVLRVNFVNALNNREFSASVDSSFKVGNAKTGEEQYKVISASLTGREAVVESVDKNKKRYNLNAINPKRIEESNTKASSTSGTNTGSVLTDAERARLRAQEMEINRRTEQMMRDMDRKNDADRREYLRYLQNGL